MTAETQVKTQIAANSVERAGEEIHVHSAIAVEVNGRKIMVEISVRRDEDTLIAGTRNDTGLCRRSLNVDDIGAGTGTDLERLDAAIVDPFEPALHADLGTADLVDHAQQTDEHVAVAGVTQRAVEAERIGQPVDAFASRDGDAVSKAAAKSGTLQGIGHLLGTGPDPDGIGAHSLRRSVAKDHIELQRKAAVVARHRNHLPRIANAGVAALAQGRRKHISAAARHQFRDIRARERTDKAQGVVASCDDLGKHDVYQSGRGHRGIARIEKTNLA